MDQPYNGPERRKYLRIPKTYSLSFYLKNTPDHKSRETILKDISKGGVRFTNSHSLKEGAHLVFEIGIPFIAPKKLTIEGYVVSCQEIKPLLVYLIRAKFILVDNQTLQLFDMLEKQKSKG